MENLPLHIILSFLGNVQDLWACEKTCKSLHTALKNDKVWQTCPRPKEEEHSTMTFREQASFQHCASRCKQWQKQSTPTVLTVLSVMEWKRLVATLVWGPFFRRTCTSDIWLYVRGDTAAVLLAIVEQFMVDHMDRSFRIYSPESTPAGEYSWLNCGRCRNELSMNRTRYGSALHESFEDSRVLKGFEKATQEFGDRKGPLIRRLALKAGIPKVDSEAVNFLWRNMCSLIHQLFFPAYSASTLRFCYNTEQDEKRTLQQGETIRSQPPTFYIDLAPRNLPCAAFVVPPREIEDAAKNLGIDWKVYGMEWLVDRKETMETELDLIVTYYCLPDGSEPSLDWYLPVVPQIVSNGTLLLEENDSDSAWEESSDEMEDDGESLEGFEGLQPWEYPLARDYSEP